MNLLKKMTPLMLATMIIAPSMILEAANAQRAGSENRGDRPRNGDRNGGSASLNREQRGQLLAERSFSNWDRRYIGKRTIKLQDDQEIAQRTREAANAHKSLEALTNTLTQQEQALKKVQANKQAINKTIIALNSAIAKAVGEKNKIKQTIAPKRQALRELQTQLQLNQRAAQTTSADVDNIKDRIKKVEENLKVTQESCAATPAPNCQAKINKLTNRLEKVKAPLADAVKLNRAAQKSVSDSEKTIANQQTQIREATKKVALIEQQNTQRSSQLSLKQTELQSANRQVTAAQNTLTPTIKTYAQSLTRRNEAVKRRDDLKEIIIQRILRINGIGASVGESAGGIDGDYYAESIGVRRGQGDGDRDGVNEGTRVGQDRSYQSGVAQGEIEGSAQANIDGHADGTRQGTSAAHVAVATTEGQSAGALRASQSDAASIGITQGKKEGATRAEATGKRVGEALGEKQAIEKNESHNISSTQISGEFAGAFSARVPDYPGFDCVSYRGRRFNGDDFGWRGQRDWRAEGNCPNFRPREHSEHARTNRPILREAFMDAYVRTYRQNRRAQFVRSIDNYYLSTYEDFRRAAFQDFSNQEYPAQRAQGRTSGYNTNYNARYPIMRDQFYNEAYQAVSANPDRNNSDYTTTYTSVEASSYRSRYEDIRVENYQRTEQATFDAKIPIQTEKFRSARFNSVDGIYANNPVLKFISSSVSDGGISGVAKADGVYQPDEVTLHNVTLTNFGKVAATNVTVSMEDGTSVKLPSIAANSTVTVKGAAKSKISRGRIGTSHKSELKVFSPLTAEAAIQGRHYYATSAAKLNLSDNVSLMRAYPMSLAGLRTDGELLINEKNSLQLNISNQSKRPYTGPMTIELSVDSRTNVITSEFDKIDSLKNSITLKSAEVLVASERDVYRPLVFSAKITKQGVTIGVLSTSYRTMAKAPYTNKAGKPVIVVDSDKNPGILLEVLSDLKGLANASVLDLSLSRLNAKVLNDGLDKKSIIVLDDSKGSTVAGVDSLLKSTEDSTMIFVDQNSAGLAIAKRNARGMRNAVKITNRLNGMNSDLELFYTNQWLDGVRDITVAAQASRENFRQVLNTLSSFNTTNAEFVAQSGRALTKSNWSTPNSTVQAMISMAAAQVMAVSSSMDQNERGDLIDLMKSDRLLFQKILRAPGDKKVKKSNLSKQLASIMMWHVLDKAVDSFDDIQDKIHHRIESRLEDEMKDVMIGEGIRIFSKGTYNYLKKFDKGLYNSIDDNKYRQSPFRL